ncbi:LytR/AlgR family response regulator transcription factor [Carboxylicivirga sp. N1Y90]|uniref:LytR/AlgR family response regulator transcription factor n=1 Tax=Carboxylicivirga fragile TaxID=3417571 RepID=UPI003D3252D1|nr:response regulator transcription factor [Marinilabiliaceae bacterium N1Y90]
MQLKSLVIDDEPLALKQICAYVEKTSFLQLQSACANAFEAIEYLHSNEVDVIFVDINMPELNGVEMVKSLKDAPMVIFTTAHSEYAIEGFRVNAIDYLLKPIGYPDFLKAANKALQHYQLVHSSQDEVKTDNDFLFIKSEYKIMRIKLQDITYVESMREYVRIHLRGEKPIMTLLSMKKLESRLPESNFMRVHRSYIVNLNQVGTIERNRIVFDRDTYIPVSDQYKERFQEYVNKNFL